MIRALVPQIPSASFAVALVNLLELGIDDTLIALRRRAAHRLADPHRNLRQTFDCLLDAQDIFALHRFLDRRDGLLDFAVYVRRDATLGVLESLLNRIDRCIRVVACFDQILAPPVFFGVGFRLPDHALDIGLGETARRLDADGLRMNAPI
jgi:hypothetical protein